MMKKCAKKQGRLIEHGVHLESHERKAAEFFLELGENIEILVPSNTLGNKNADWLMRGKVWEVKSLQTNNANTILVRLKRASKQSANLIIDLRELKSGEKGVLKIVQSKFFASKRFRQLLIITKKGKLIELRKH